MSAAPKFTRDPVLADPLWSTSAVRRWFHRELSIRGVVSRHQWLLHQEQHRQIRSNLIGQWGMLHCEHFNIRLMTVAQHLHALIYDRRELIVFPGLARTVACIIHERLQPHQWDSNGFTMDLSAFNAIRWRLFAPDFDICST